MNLIDKIKRLIALAKSEMKVLEDKDALDALELYPQWQSGKAYATGDRVRYNDKLWKVVQGHTSQESWKPDVAISLFTQVQIESEQGTKDNPIPFSFNMELVEGKYYLDEGVTYLCIESLAQCFYHLKDIPRYAQAVE
jgi:chitodextrinase